MSITTNNLTRLYSLGLSQEQLEAILMMLAQQDEAHEDEIKLKLEQAAHNYKKHQAAQRQQRRRERVAMPDLFERGDDESRYIDAAIAETITESVAMPPSVTLESRSSHAAKRNPHKENTSSLRSEVDDDDGNAREAVGNAMVSEEAHQAVEAIVAEAGLDLKFLPPGWCGAANYVQAALNAGISMNHIRIGCTVTLRWLQQNGRGPPDNFAYFRKQIARTAGDLRRPSPIVIEPKLEIIHGGKSHDGTRPYSVSGRRPDGHSRNYGSATDAASDLRQYFARRAEEEERAADGNDRGSGRTFDGSLSPGSV